MKSIAFDLYPNNGFSQRKLQNSLCLCKRLCVLFFIRHAPYDSVDARVRTVTGVSECVFGCCECSIFSLNKESDRDRKPVKRPMFVRIRCDYVRCCF